MVDGADAALEVDVINSSLRDRPHNEHDIGSAETDNLQRANQTEPVVNTNISDEPPLSIAESSGQILALTTVSASSLPDLGEENDFEKVSLLFKIAAMEMLAMEAGSHERLAKFR